MKTRLGLQDVLRQHGSSTALECGGVWKKSKEDQVSFLLRVNESERLWPWSEVFPELKNGHPSADPKPQVHHLPRPGDCLACGGLLGASQGHCVGLLGIPARALTAHSGATAANRQRCTLKVFVKAQLGVVGGSGVPF